MKGDTILYRLFIFNWIKDNTDKLSNFYAFDRTN